MATASKGDSFTVKDLKQRLDEDELDLTMLELTQIPVKAMAQLPKATKIDLSVNRLQTLPDDFATSLTHLVKLDLSDNQIRLLPDNFGELRNLEHLDLYKNSLETLPISIAKLKSLRWLDLKNNPLEPELAKVAGDCLDDKQCKRAATRMIQHMQNVQSDMEREKQRRLEIERERKAIEEAEKREQQLARKRDKDRKKQETKVPPPVPPKKKTLTSNGEAVDADPKHKLKSSSNKTSGSGNRPTFGQRLKTCFACLLSLVMTLVAAAGVCLLILAAVFYNNCSSQLDPHWVPNSEPLCHDILHWSASGKMPDKVPDHARFLMIGLNEWASEKTVEVINYDYSNTWEHTKSIITKFGNKSYKYGEKAYKTSASWWKREGEPRMRQLLTWLAEKLAELRVILSELAGDLWTNLGKYAAIAGQHLYKVLQQVIAYVSTWLHYLVESADQAYQNREQYWTKAKHYWENMK